MMNTTIRTNARVASATTSSMDASCDYRPAPDDVVSTVGVVTGYGMLAG